MFGKIEQNLALTYHDITLTNIRILVSMCVIEALGISLGIFIGWNLTRPLTSLAQGMKSLIMLKDDNYSLRFQRSRFTELWRCQGSFKVLERYERITLLVFLYTYVCNV